MIAEGDVVVAELPQADGRIKRRPVLILCVLPGFGDLLACGISTQIQQEIKGFDVVLTTDDPDFAASGLKASSLVRLSFLAALPRSRVVRHLGKISQSTLRQLQRNLAVHLCQGHQTR